MRFFAPTKISENISETPEGYLLCTGVPIARTGEMVYAASEIPVEPDGDGKIIIERDEDTVFDPQCMASFEGKALTITHPEEFVSPDNWSELAKGILQNIRRGDGENKDDLLADILVTDAIAIGLVRKGLREVSCGYDAEYIQIKRGRGKQKSIIGNHLALVEKGRAGQSYAITDHNGKGSQMSLIKDKFKALFTKTMDDAMKEMKDEDFGEKKKEESKDEGAKSFDELKSMVKDLGEKIEGMQPKAKDEFPKKEEKKEESSDDGEKKEDEEKSESSDEGSALEDRIKAIEQAIKKLMGEDDSESADADEEEESSDEDSEETSGMTGDSFARAEILSPGIKRTKDMKAVALKAAYGTKDGKAIIESLNGGKKPTFDSAERVDTLFIAASELMKVKRSGDLSKTKQVRDSADMNTSQGISAMDLNAINDKFYNKK